MPLTLVRQILGIGLSALVLLGFYPANGQAAEGDWTMEPEIEARLISAVDGVGELDTVPAGLHLYLPKGWKTYWRSPGDAGLPVVVDWAASDNVDQVGFSWPAPHRFQLFGLDTFGYEQEVIFPLAVTPAVQGQDISLRGDVNVLVCSDICIPYTLPVSLSLPAGPAAPDARSANLIDRFAAQVPDGGEASGFTLASLSAQSAAGEFGRISVEVEAREPFVEPDVIVENDLAYAFGTPEITVDEDGKRLRAVFDALHEVEVDGPLEGLPVTITVVDGPRAMEAAGSVGAMAATVGGTLSSGFAGFASMIAIALVGGFILNFMPCVLPVLSLKLASAASYGGAELSVIRRGFLATVAGIVVSFAVLGGAIALLKGAGATVGWGVHFQQPLFLIFMIVVITLFAANLWGWFDIALPGSASDGVVKATSGEGLGGHFATGAFAALLATPCSAPFVGTAVAFALTRGNGEILAIFIALGVGLAIPYLLVAAVPSIARAMPKPGVWMLTFKRVLAAALVLTALWLLWVLSSATSTQAAGLVAGLVIAAALVLGWRKLPRLAYGGGAVGAIALAFLVPGLPGFAASESTAKESADWRPFEEAVIGDLVEAGEVVFVDVTADWCITCKANKALVLGRGEVASRLGDGSIETMQADWTRPNEAIANYLASHGRYGIPFNVVYGRDAPDGIVLPELLTQDAVLAAIEKAGG